MAAVLRFTRFQPSKVLSTSGTSIRFFATTQTASEDKEGWFTKLMVPKREPFKESHSRMLSDKETIYQLQTHNVKPDSMTDYVKNYENFVKLANQKNDLDADLIGSWLVDVGDQDQAIHLWRYKNGYTGLGKANSLLQTDSDYAKLNKERCKYLRSRLNQYLLSFSFWNAPKPRTGPNLYEMRSYILRAGHLIEWGNSWARAIHYRQNESEPFCGMFSQCGRLYNVHHLWVYKDLKTRKEVREAAWQKPGWDECVAYTVPLIREMESRIMYPTDFSPTK